MTYKLMQYPGDRLTFSYTLGIGAYLLAFYVVMTVGEPALEALVVLYLMPLLLVWLVLMFIVNMWRRQWLRLLSLLAAPSIAFIVFWGLTQIANPWWIRFQLNKSYYSEQVAELPATRGKPRYKEFDWGVTGSVAASCYYALIYDESDKAFQQDDKNISTEAFGGHFYFRYTCYP